jgi:deoxyxylulose-5-phosphate synthase
VVRETAAGGGYVVAVGETVYRALDAVIRLQEKGTKVGLINKPTLNVVDAKMMKTLAAAPFVLVVEGWNVKTGLGSRFGSYLLQAGFKGKYNHIGTHLEGSGGLWQQMGYQGLDSEGILRRLRHFCSAWSLMALARWRLCLAGLESRGMSRPRACSILTDRCPRRSGSFS